MDIGLKGFMEECRANIAEVRGGTKEKQEKVDFWNACIVLCDGLITYAHRMADEAERQAAECSNDKRKAELSRTGKSTADFPSGVTDGMVHPGGIPYRGTDYSLRVRQIRPVHVSLLQGGSGSWKKY